LPFEFRFAALLELRRQERDEVGAAVGQANAAIDKVNEHVDEKQHERMLLRDGSNVSRRGDVSVDALLSLGRYDLQLQADIEALNLTLGELITELERRRGKLVDAEAELKRFQKLRDNAELEFRALETKREHAEADEVTTRRYTIQRQR
jgi:flagellar FliJ protein|tara:strand:+ start:169 stop:615 length:447 start_codon:yes stop_codon:yes gene_type:complete